MSNPSPPRTSTGHDSPISDITDDQYGRFAVAQEMYEICTSAPNQYSTRIGLYGPWGSGKTSALNFLKSIAEADGNLVVTFSASGAPDINALWVSFYAAFREAAEKVGVKPTFINRLKETSKKYSSRGNQLAPAARRAVDFFGGGFGEVVEKAIETAAASAGNTKLDSEFINSLKARVNEDPTKRIIVFIDDLDRADPKVVPLVLLALRELLDIPGFCFVIAIDYDVVTRALGAYNTAWKDRGGIFLEKIIDFAITLPSPTESQLKALALQEFENCCSPNSYISASVVSKLLPELPRNPRQLKLMARILGTYKDQARRHHVDELDIVFMVRMAALRVISSTFAENVQFAIRSVSYSDFREDVTDPTEPEKKFDSNVSVWAENLVKQAPDLEDSRKVEAQRILIEMVNSKFRESSSEKLFYTCRVLLGRSTFTQREFDDFVSDFRKRSNENSIAVFVSQWSKANALETYVDLINAALAKYLDSLRLSKTAYAVDDRQVHIADADFILKLLQVIWKNFLHQHFEWVEKTRAFHDIQNDLIGAEKRPNPALVNMFKVLLDIAGTDQECLSLLGLIGIEEPDALSAQQLFAEISPIIAKVVGRLLAARATTNEVRSMYTSPLMGWVVRSPNGPLFSLPEFTREAIAEANLVTDLSAKAENAYSYLSAIQSGRTYSEVDSLKALVSNVPLVEYLWQTIIQVKPHEDAIHNLCIYKTKLVQQGMSESIVPWPTWFKHPEKSKIE
jgi:KAP family P-loop domain